MEVSFAACLVDTFRFSNARNGFWSRLLSSLKPLLNRAQVESQFDRAAATYDSVAALQRQMGDSLLQRTLSHELPRNSRLLDLGCGTGHLLAAFADAQFESLHGLDLSANMIEIARSKCSQAEYSHASIESMPMADEFFDVLTSNAAIQWCDPASAAREMFRVLRTGGCVFANTFVVGTLQQWADAFEAAGIESRVHPMHSAEEIKQAFAAAGFVELEVRQVVESSRFESIEAMFASIRRLGASNASDSRSRPISKSEYRKLKHFFEQRLADQGILELDFAWVELYARK